MGGGVQVHVETSAALNNWTHCFCSSAFFFFSTSELAQTEKIDLYSMQLFAAMFTPLPRTSSVF